MSEIFLELTPFALIKDSKCFSFMVEKKLNVRKIEDFDNPTFNSSIVRYDSNYSHKPRGTTKPTFSSLKGYLPSITSISKIYNSYS